MTYSTSFGPDQDHPQACGWSPPLRADGDGEHGPPADTGTLHSPHHHDHHHHHMAWVGGRGDSRASHTDPLLQAHSGSSRCGGSRYRGSRCGGSSAGQVGRQQHPARCSSAPTGHPSGTSMPPMPSMAMQRCGARCPASRHGSSRVLCMSALKTLCCVLLRRSVLHALSRHCHMRCRMPRLPSASACRRAHHHHHTHVRLRAHSCMGQGQGHERPGAGACPWPRPCPVLSTNTGRAECSAECS